jgi:hypothetical protein
MEAVAEWKWRSVAESKPFFIPFGGPKAHEHSSRDDRFVAQFACQNRLATLPGELYCLLDVAFTGAEINLHLSQRRSTRGRDLRSVRMRLCARIVHP